MDEKIIEEEIIEEAPAEVKTTEEVDESQDLRARLEKIFSEGGSKDFKSTRIVSAEEWKKIVGDEGDTIYTTISPVKRKFSTNRKDNSKDIT
jgi:hypothetical protein